VSESPQVTFSGQDTAALVLLDEAGRLLSVSPAFRSLLGYTAEEPLPLDLQALTHPDDHDRLQTLTHADDLLERAGATLALSIRMRHRDGSWRTARGSAASLLGLPRTPALVLVFHASGEPSQREQAMIAARTRLATIFQHLIDGILVQDAAGRILYANRVAAQMCGFESSRALLAATARELAQRIALLDEAGQPYPAAGLPGRRVLQGEDVPPLTLALRNRATGEQRWVSIASTPVDDVLSQSRLVISVLHDITERRRVEEELRRAVTLRDTFLAAASHELRTPLTSLRGYLDITRRRLDRGASVESTGDALDVAIRQVARLTRLVNELLDASRLTRGLFVVDPQPLDLVPLVRHVVDADRLATQGEHAIAVLAPEPGPRVNADADRLEQVLANLIGNARKYSTPDQPITVTVTETAEAARVSVRDAGIGIPLDEQTHIFEPFRRAGNVDKGLTGFGLGLYVASEIVRAHAGTLTVESQPGAGSTFTVALPLAHED